MKKISFIYAANSEYFQKKITLNKNEIRTENVYFDFRKVTDLDFITLSKQRQQRKTTEKEMYRLVKNNDVIISTSDFDNISIVTKGGIIITDDISSIVLSLANIKVDCRRNELDSVFLDNKYSKESSELYKKHNQMIMELLKLQKKFLTLEKNASIEDYQLLLECLVGITNPVNNGNYEEKAKQLLKEYPNN